MLGTFAIYHRTPRTPTEADFATIEQAAKLASIAIEWTHAEEQRRLAASVVQHTRESIIVTDTLFRIIDVNPAFTELTGYAREDVLGRKPDLLESERQSSDFYTEMLNSLIEEDYWRGELWSRDKRGKPFAALMTVSTVRGEDGRIRQYVGMFSDITPLKEYQRHLERLAHFDALTQLPNRTLFAEQLRMALARTKRDDDLLAVCYMDLDGLQAGQRPVRPCGG